MFPSYNESLIHVVSTLIEDFIPPQSARDDHSKFVSTFEIRSQYQTHLSVMMSLWENMLNNENASQIVGFVDQQ